MRSSRKWRGASLGGACEGTDQPPRPVVSAEGSIVRVGPLFSFGAPYSISGRRRASIAPPITRAPGAPAPPPPAAPRPRPAGAPPAPAPAAPPARPARPAPGRGGPPSRRSPAGRGAPAGAGGRGGRWSGWEEGGGPTTGSARA